MKCVSSRGRDARIDAVLYIQGVQQGRQWPRDGWAPRLSLLALASMVALVTACGAKTGLEVPDIGPHADAGVDASRRVDAGPDAGLPCIELTFDGGPVDLPLDTEVVVGRADVLFLVDTTASMGEEIDNIRNDLRDRIAPGIRDAIPDSQLGVASFADFPVAPCGDERIDSPFQLNQPVTNDIVAVQESVNALRVTNGRDEPESQVEALYQLATAEGLPPYVPAAFGCPSGGFGYPCFRTDALPVVLLFTDASFHNGPGGSSPYPCAASLLPVVPHTYEEAVAALSSADIRVMGLFSGALGSDASDVRSLALDTGAVDTLNGQPLVFDIGSRGEALSESVIQSIRTLADVIVFDIDVVLVDPDRSDGIDPRQFVASVVPLRAEPASGVGEIDTAAGIFRRVRTGTRVVFQLLLQNDVVAPGVGPQRFLLEVVFRGDGRTRIGSRTIEIVVPGADGNGC